MSAGKRRLRLEIAYDGRPFAGWQSQPNGEGIQDYLERAVGHLCGEKVTVHGSGRTDAGVHALGQVAHAEVPEARLSLAQWVFAINAHLPPEIRVMRTAWTSQHSRFDAIGKIYHYRIWNGPVMPPLELGRAWHLPVLMDESALCRAAAALEGRHDFWAFAANRGTPVEDTVRTIHRIEMEGNPGGLLTFHFEGEGFLYRMVRLMTGAIVRCGQGKADEAWLKGFLTAKKEAKANHLKSRFAAPAEGLYLAKVLYPPEED